MMTEIFIVPIFPGVTNFPKRVNKAVKCATLISMMKDHDPRGKLLPKHVNIGAKCVTLIINDDKFFYCPYHPMGLLLPKTREKRCEVYYFDSHR